MSTKDTWTFGDMLAYYRQKYDTDKAIILRPGQNHSFIESNREEMMLCLDELEKAAFMGEKLSPLQSLALELIIPDELHSMRKKLP